MTMPGRMLTLAGLTCASLLAATPAVAQPAAPADAPDIELFMQATAYDEQFAQGALAEIAAAWDDGYASIVVDLIDMLRRTSLVDPRSWIVLGRLVQFLEAQTGQTFENDLARWHAWVWSLPYEPHPEYGRFKGLLYRMLDPRFESFFQPPVEASIRLDEVDWGGVAVNGIPPLDHPAHVSAADATYLDDDDVVFGFYTDGAARAYPKRILAWHEMALDTVGEVELTLVYCTLCGTVIPYDSELGGRVRTFGTSGLLYQSNKLMFDAATNSLWSSLEGRPVVGPLVGSGLRLSVLPVVTTTWGEWRALHPETTALSIETGYSRDYSEGAAYRSYFATDALMFGVSRMDDRLPNKAEVLVPRLATASAAPLAISTAFLDDRPVYQFDADGRAFVIVTSAAGANRVYESGSRRFAVAPGDERLVDADGGEWVVEEEYLRSAGAAGVRLPRVPAHRAFWFAWYAQHPDTRLIQ